MDDLSDLPCIDKAAIINMDNVPQCTLDLKYNHDNFHSEFVPKILPGHFGIDLIKIEVWNYNNCTNPIGCAYVTKITNKKAFKLKVYNILKHEVKIYYKDTELDDFSWKKLVKEWKELETIAITVEHI